MALQKVLGVRLPATTLLCGGVSLIAYLWPGLRDWLVYDRQGVLEGQFWRLGTACFVHFSASHLLWDLLLFAGAGWALQAGGRRGFAILCCLAAVLPSIYLLLSSPDLVRYGGLSGLATGAVAYLCLCELPRAGGSRNLWLGILALIGLKIAFEAIFRAPIFAAGGETGFQVLPSVHAIGLGAALAVYGALRPGKGVDSVSLRPAA